MSQPGAHSSGDPATRETVLSESLPANSNSEATPEKIGAYKITRLLGQGAMGIVYLARDTLRDRDVALKVPNVDLMDDTKQRQRFFQEARVAATISHPNICAVYEVGREDGYVFIAMQFINGRPLSDFVRADRPLPIDQVALIVRTLAEAMHHAHQQGVVHRDLKPDNVLITGDREPIVMDFGLAIDVDMPTDVRLTQAGTIMGSPAYMSPEQVENDLNEIGPATDIYSLGVLLYELLTGRLPFEGSLASVLAQILGNEPQPPSQLRGAIPPSLDGICANLLAKSPERRFRSMQEVAAALDDFLKETAGVAPAGPTGSRLSAFAREQATRDGRMERLEMQKRHVENLRKHGYHRDAIAMLQRMAQLRDPRYAEYVDWANEQIPILESEPEAIRTQRHDALDLALMMIERHEYQEAQELLEEIPATMRTAEINATLKQAKSANRECLRLIDKVKTGINAPDPSGLLPDVERLLQLRPGLKRAHRWYEKITGRKYGEVEERKRAPAYFWPVVIGAIVLAVPLVWVVSKLFSDIDDVEGDVQKVVAATEPRAPVKKTKTPKPKPPPKTPERKVEPKKKKPIVAGKSGKAPDNAITNSLNMKLVLIPAGAFEMGSAAAANERPRHKVTITKPFYIGVFEVTQQEYQRVMGSNPSWFASTGGGRAIVGNADTGRFPVESVSRKEGAEFCRRLSALPEEMKAGRRYRLPTEAEWEFAARAGSTTAWSFGDDAAQLRSYAWHAEPGGRTHQIGTKRPNKLGLYDMYGNVWERCSDGYSRNYYANSPDSDPGGPAKLQVFDVKRGGGWSSSATQCRSATRGYYGMNLNTIGLRVVCDKQ